MIQPSDQWLSVLVDRGEVDHPAEVGIDLAVDRDVDAIAVPVHASALVTRRHLREKVRGFESIAPFETSAHVAF